MTTAETLELRPSVAAFAQLMEQTLRHHDQGKGGQPNWRKETPAWLFGRLQYEVAETYLSMHGHHQGMSTRESRIRSEAVDVANFCMMLVDRVEGLADDDR